MIDKDISTKQVLEIMGVVMGAFLIIKGIIDDEDPIKEISDFIQENINGKDTDMGSVG